MMDYIKYGINSLKTNTRSETTNMINNINLIQLDSSLDLSIRWLISSLHFDISQLSFIRGGLSIVKYGITRKMNNIQPEVINLMTYIKSWPTKIMELTSEMFTTSHNSNCCRLFLPNKQHVIWGLQLFVISTAGFGGEILLPLSYDQTYEVVVPV